MVRDKRGVKFQTEPLSVFCCPLWNQKALYRFLSSRFARRGEKWLPSHFVTVPPVQNRRDFEHQRLLGTAATSSNAAYPVRNPVDRPSFSRSFLRMDRHG
jgi:hypothetical protein